MPKPSKQHLLETPKQQLVTSLQHVREEKAAVSASLNSLVSKVENDITDILKEKSINAFFNKYASANRDMASCLEVLTKMKAILSDDNGSSSEQSDSDTDSQDPVAGSRSRAHVFKKFQLDASTQSVDSAPGRLISQESDHSDFTLRRWSLQHHPEEFSSANLQESQKEDGKVTSAMPVETSSADSVLRCNLSSAGIDRDQCEQLAEDCQVTSTGFKAVKLPQRLINVACDTTVNDCTGDVKTDSSAHGGSSGKEVSTSIKLLDEQTVPLVVSLTAIPEEGQSGFPPRLSRPVPSFRPMEHKSGSGSSESSYHSGVEDSSDSDQFHTAKEALLVGHTVEVSTHSPPTSTVPDEMTEPKLPYVEYDQGQHLPAKDLLSHGTSTGSGSLVIDKMSVESLTNSEDTLTPSKASPSIPFIDPIDFYRPTEHVPSSKGNSCEAVKDDNVGLHDSDFAASVDDVERSVEQAHRVVIPLPSFTLGEEVPVNAPISNDSCKLNPSDFWLQLLDVESVNDLVHMTLEGSKQLLDANEIKVGMFCCILYVDRVWHRVQVWQVFPGDKTAEVLFVDVGKVKKVSLDSFHPLPPGLALIPQHAVNCVLRGVTPKQGAWSQEALQWFYKLVTGLETSLRAVFYPMVGDKIPVDLLFNVPLGQPGRDIQMTASNYLCTAGYAIQAEISDEPSTPVDHMPSSVTCSQIAGENQQATPSDQVTSPAIETQSEMPASSQVSAADNSEGNIVNCSIDSGLGDSAKDKLSTSDQELATLPDCRMTSKSSDNLQTLSKSVSAPERFPTSLSTSPEMSDGEQTAGRGLFRDDDSKGPRGQAWSHNESELSGDETPSCFVIPPAKVDFLEENMVPIVMAHVVSPEEFYVHLVDENASQIDDLREQMNNYYHTVSYNKLHPSMIEPGTFWSCRYKQDNWWYRAEVLEVLKSPPDVASKSRKKSLKHRQMDCRFRVRYIDYGNEEEVCFRDVMPLASEFTELHAFAVGCSLANLRPRQRNPSAVATWSSEAIQCFVDMTASEKCLTLQVVSSQRRSNTLLPVQLWDSHNSKDILISAELISAGWAEWCSPEGSRGSPELANASNGSPASREPATNNQYQYKKGQPPPVGEEAFRDFDPMGSDFLNECNSYHINPDDVGIATVGHKAKDEQYICKFFGSGRRCPRGDKCRLEHTRTGPDGATHDTEHVYAYGAEMTLPEEGSKVYVQVSAVYNPSHFYVIMPYGTDDIITGEGGDSLLKNSDNLDVLVLGMTKHYSKAVFQKTTLLMPALGMIMAARSSDGRWFRARVVETNDNADRIKVFYVDFGDSEWVTVSDLRDIKPEFLHLPFQAVECFLANIEPRGTSAWSQESRSTFRQLAEKQILIAEILSKICHSALLVNLRLVQSGETINEILVGKGHAQYVPESEYLRFPRPSVPNGQPAGKYTPG